MVLVSQNRNDARRTTHTALNVQRSTGQEERPSRLALTDLRQRFQIPEFTDRRAELVEQPAEHTWVSINTCDQVSSQHSPLMQTPGLLCSLSSIR